MKIIEKLTLMLIFTLLSSNNVGYSQVGSKPNFKTTLTLSEDQIQDLEQQQELMNWGAVLNQMAQQMETPLQTELPKEWSRQRRLYWLRPTIYWFLWAFSPVEAFSQIR